MSNLAILCTAVGNHFDKIFEVTRPFIHKYALRVDAELVTIRKHSCPMWGRFQAYDLFDRYARILYLDADLLIRSETPNLFSLVPSTHVGACLTSKNTHYHDLDILEMQSLNRNIGWNSDYFNSGVIMASRCHRELFNSDTQITPNRHGDQSLLNYRCQELNYPIFDIGYRFNHTTVPPGRNEMTSYITHFCGISTPKKLSIIKACAEKLLNSNHS